MVINFGLNLAQCVGPGWFPSKTATFCPLSAAQTWIRPSLVPARSQRYSTAASFFSKRPSFAICRTICHVVILFLCVYILQFFSLVKGSTHTCILKCKNGVWTQTKLLTWYYILRIWWKTCFDIWGWRTSSSLDKTMNVGIFKRCHENCLKL